MLDTTGLNEGDKQLFENFYLNIQKQFNVEVVDEVNIPIEELELFKFCNNVAFDQAIKINTGGEDVFITIFQINYSATKGGIRSTTEDQVCVYTLLSKDFGHLLIRRETL